MYKLVLEKVFCEKETPPAWWGSDDVWISFVSSTGRIIGPTPPTAQVTRWRQDGFDTGDLYEANHTIYVGEAQGRIFFAALALEVDNTNRAAIYGAIGLGLMVFLGYSSAALVAASVAVIVELVLWPLRDAGAGGIYHLFFRHEFLSTETML